MSPSTRSLLQTLLLGAGFGAAFVLGQAFAPKTASASGTPLAAGGLALPQGGRGPIQAPPPSEPLPGSPTGGDARPDPIYYPDEAGGAASANGFVAVTGSYGIGTSVLYLIDTNSRQLAVYEARGGSAEQRRIVLVGARRIDLDLQLHGYNDRSEFEYADLQELFEKRGRKDHRVRTGLESDAPVRRSGK